MAVVLWLLDVRFTQGVCRRGFQGDRREKMSSGKMAVM